MSETAILIVDDERAFLDTARRLLVIEGYSDLTLVSDPRQVPDLLPDKDFDVAFLDINMPHLDGLELLQQIKERRPQTECIMVTADGSVPSVVRAIKLGAYDYLVKPVAPEQLTHVLDRALERRRLLESLMLRSAAAASRSLDHPEAFREIVTGSQQMLRLLHEAELHASSEIPILITGDTGVGKELLANAIHRASRRAAGPMVAVNMLAISPTLFESEFFGHARGAFTGADRERAGYLARARGGTLFLDEIGDLNLEVQGKLLRILQEGEYTPVGKTNVQQADVRFIAATNLDLEKRVQQRRFRKDLFYRLQFAHLELPPLSQRTEDIPLLAAHFLEHAERSGLSLSPEAEEALLRHHWPGNVRELRGVLEAAANLAESGEITEQHLRLPAPRGRAAKKAVAADGEELEPLAEVERRHILAVYEALGQNKTQAARALGIGLQTLHRKLKAYNVS
jgi:two-component system response regulator AtoC